jgi:hypothetical protein
MPSDLARRIRAAVLKSLSARNRYTDQVTAQLTRSLDQAEKEAAKAILKYRTLGSLPDNKLAALKGLEKLQAELSGIIKKLKNDQTLVFKKHTMEIRIMTRPCAPPVPWAIRTRAARPPSLSSPFAPASDRNAGKHQIRSLWT